MRLPFNALILFSLLSTARAQPVDFYRYALGYYSLDPVSPGESRLKVDVPPDARGQRWILLDERGLTWPITHVVADASETLYIHAPAGRSLRLLFGDIPAEFLTESTHSPSDRDAFLSLDPGPRLVPQPRQSLAGLQRPLRMLGIWIFIAVISFTLLGKWYRDQIS